MTYDELAKLRALTDESDEDAESAEILTAALEETLAENSFRGAPRSLRAVGLGYGCMEIFCVKGTFRIVRNNGAGLDELPQYDNIKECFISLISAIYGSRKPKDFAGKEAEKRGL